MKLHAEFVDQVPKDGLDGVLENLQDTLHGYRVLGDVEEPSLASVEDGSDAFRGNKEANTVVQIPDVLAAIPVHKEEESLEAEGGAEVVGVQQALHMLLVEVVRWNRQVLLLHQVEDLAGGGAVLDREREGFYKKKTKNT